MQPFIPARLPLDRINHADPELIAALSTANRAVAQYSAQTQYTPGAHFLLATFSQQEAVFSSRIEGSQSTLSEVLQFEDGKNFSGERRDDLSEVHNYTLALTEGTAEIARRPFSLSLLKQLHAILLSGSVRGKTKSPGEFRNKAVWIGRDGAKPEDATYHPPEALLVSELMENWQEYYSANAPDALVQAAILHAQFELIHPFSDGNGRLGRLIIPLFLYEKKVIATPNFYLSAYLEKNRDVYMSTLQTLNTIPGNWNSWVLFFLHAVTEQAFNSSKKLGRISTLYEHLKSTIRNYTNSQFAIPVLDVIFQRLVFKQAQLAKALAAQAGASPSPPTLHTLLTTLVKHNVIEILLPGSGGRGTIYVLTSLQEILEADEDE